VKAITSEIKGLSCDAPGCGYVDMTVPVEDYEKSIGKPCPDCGASLLTQEDYNTVMTMIELMEAMNEVLPERSREDNVVRINFKLDGTGIPTVVEEEDK
jgi:hypothetical protein